MFRPQLEALETRETPAVAVTEYLFTATVVNADSAVRPRMFALVDRTPLAHDSVWLDLGTTARAPAGGSAGAHVLSQDIPISASSGDSFYGTGILKSNDSGRTW